MWSGSYYSNGYGQAWSRELQRSTQAHRLVYEHIVGRIPAGLQLDHACRVRGCVNPAHLRVVTCRDNIMAPGTTCLAAANVAKTHCPSGHAYDEPNTYFSRNRRFCRTCKRAHKREARRSAHGAGPTRDAVSTGTRDAATTGPDSFVTLRVGSPETNGRNPLGTK